ncbi:MAG: CDP-alcohol phosphatidyltransferase family protein [Bacteroidota bacterium]|nr:CDP-alcohol phosphatidyltransferase family protein [Bacteroidota bacterium]MDP4191837.1 CDP-alcohol phosphatidyltransferase family protein [Bacteroidota bacterium]MDP4195273.1 CDP-alcohol phosphatidyltransferase family protein [Bacteroidota bacterium]
MSLIELTYKAKETEEWLDIKFYRPFGYLIARICKVLRITPNAVSLIGMFIGILAGHLFYYSDIKVTIAGIILLIISEAMDSADGQLARMTNKKSRLGRILDGFVTNLIFLSIYIHLSLRMASEGSQIVWVIALLAAVSHSLQSAVADHYRNGYLNFVVSPEKSELDSSAKLSEQFNKLSWSKEPFEKFWNLLYLNYTREQEMLSPKFFMLKQKTDSIFNGILPENLRELYKANSRELVKFYNILTTNTRMIFLFFALLINIPWLYLAFELTILNALLLHVVTCQELTCNMIIEKITMTEKEVEC